MKKDNVENYDENTLRQMVAELENVEEEKLDDAVCDIIDIGNRPIIFLIDSLPQMSEEVGSRVVQKLEDFFYFHPEKGGKVVDRLKQSVREAPEMYRAGLLSALSDILDATDESGEIIGTMGEEAMSVLCSDADITRIGKAIEILVRAEEANSIPHIINLMIKNTDKLDKFENYQFIETSLLALKRLGGEALLRLLVNPLSDSAIKQLRVEWRTKEQKLLDDTLIALQKLDSDFAQVMIKVVDLSEFNLPFAAMLNEGIKHSDKWVRQAAVEAMRKTSEEMTPEALSRMLGDPAPEVRLMAITSLGAFDKSQTGDLLLDLASREEESIDIRLNALYALYSQGNILALQQLAAKKDNEKISVNAEGLAALLMPHDQGLHKMLDVYVTTKESLLPEAAHYLSEIAVPEDIGAMVAVHSKGNEEQRDKMIRFLKAFIENNNGPKLEAAMKSQLNDAERNALKRLIPEKNNKTNDEEDECDCCEHVVHGHHHHHHHR
ncbi:MAG: HEAT repeat domain-containing protein [Candidatus Riflebacteria bacterium]|nr:HEAT repeat domain-containing protein [Candidatus Riflebacteria bacterium]